MKFVMYISAERIRNSEGEEQLWKSLEGREHNGSSHSLKNAGKIRGNNHLSKSGMLKVFIRLIPELIHHSNDCQVVRHPPYHLATCEEKQADFLWRLPCLHALHRKDNFLLLPQDPMHKRRLYSVADPRNITSRIPILPRDMFLYEFIFIFTPSCSSV